MPQLPKLYDIEVEKVASMIQCALEEGVTYTRVGVPCRSDCTDEQWISLIRELLRPSGLQIEAVVGESGRPYAVDIRWRQDPDLAPFYRPSDQVISTVHLIRTAPKRRKVYGWIRRIGPGSRQDD